MEKIFFGKLNLEITRRCQLKCAHCMRGDTQDMDMSKEIIDSILDQTAGIFEVFFTGGEPTLNVDGMGYFLKELKRRNIPLGGLGFITNGVSISDALKSFLLQAYEYITSCRENCEAFRTDATIAMFHRISIGISCDDYHIGSDPDAAKAMYESFLPYEGCYIYINRFKHLIKEGRAADAAGAVSIPFGYSFPRVKIGIAYKGHTPICGDSIRIDKMLDFCDAYIPCQLDITAKGKIIPIIEAQNSYLREDKTIIGICQYKDGRMPPIIQSVQAYNHGALPCYIGYNIPLGVESNEMFYFDVVRQVDSAEETQYFDPLFSSVSEEIKALTLISQLAYAGTYLQYLIGRLPRYCDKKELLRDFPYSNDYFYQKVVQTISSTDAQTAVQWIVDNKDRLWYRVDDKLVPMAKSIFKKRAIQKIRKDNNGLWHQLFSKVISYEFEKIPYLNE